MQYISIFVTYRFLNISAYQAAVNLDNTFVCINHFLLLFIETIQNISYINLLNKLSDHDCIIIIIIIVHIHAFIGNISSSKPVTTHGYLLSSYYVYISILRFPYALSEHISITELLPTPRFVENVPLI